MARRRTAVLGGFKLRTLFAVPNADRRTFVYDGIKNLTFAPSTRVAYNASPEWAVAVEEYADYGAVRHFNRRSDESHQILSLRDLTRSSAVADPPRRLTA